jgi:hypothetical protein
MRTLVRLWKNADTIIGRIFKFVLEKSINVNGVGEEELKEFIREIGSTNPDAQFNDLVRQDTHCYNFVFQRPSISRGVTKIRQEALEYAMSL